MKDLYGQLLLSLLEVTEYKIELKNGKTMTKVLSDSDYRNIKNSIGTPKGIVKSITPVGKVEYFDDEGEFEKKEKALIKDREKKVEDYYKKFDPNFKLNSSAEEEYEKLYPGDGSVNKHLLNNYKITPYELDFCIIAELKNIIKYKNQNINLSQIRCITNDKDYKINEVPKELQDRGVKIYPSEFSSIIEYIKKIRHDLEVILKVNSVFDKCIIAGAKEGIPKPLNIDKKDVQTYLRYYEMKDVNTIGKEPLYNFFLDYLKSNLK